MLLLESPQAQLRSAIDFANQEIPAVEVFSLSLFQSVDDVVPLLMTDMDAGLQLLDGHEEVLLYMPKRQVTAVL